MHFAGCRSRQSPAGSITPRWAFQTLRVSAIGDLNVTDVAERLEKLCRASEVEFNQTADDVEGVRPRTLRSLATLNLWPIREKEGTRKMTLLLRALRQVNPGKPFLSPGLDLPGQHSNRSPLLYLRAI